MTVTKINAQINPTEDPEKIANGIHKIFGEVDLEVTESSITGELDGLTALSTFRSRIASDKIKDTLSKVFTRWSDGYVLSFGLNRQAAHAGHVSVTLENEDPMGPIQVTIEDDIDDVITFLTE